MAKKVTIKDIADMAGVSIATVSHVINRTRYVSPDLVEKIENIIIETGYHKKIEEKEICSLLGKVGLCTRDYIDREVNSSLSGGEIKRIEIATVLARNTKLTIFDEPEAGIDLWSFNELIDAFVEIKENYAGTLLIISHQERILNIADEIIVIANGVVKDIGKKEEILPTLLEVSNTGDCCLNGGNN